MNHLPALPAAEFLPLVGAVFCDRCGVELQSSTKQYSCGCRLIDAETLHHEAARAVAAHLEAPELDGCPAALVRRLADSYGTQIVLQPADEDSWLLTCHTVPTRQVSFDAVDAAWGAAVELARDLGTALHEAADADEALIMEHHKLGQASIPVVMAGTANATRQARDIAFQLASTLATCRWVGQDARRDGLPAPEVFGAISAMHDALVAHYQHCNGHF